MKMRILPANFEALEEAFVSVGAQMIHDYKVPPDSAHDLVTLPKSTGPSMSESEVSSILTEKIKIGRAHV